MTKTVSSRIPKDLYDKLKEKCDNEGCKPNDFIKSILENELEQEPKPEPKIIIEDVKEEPKPTIELIPEIKEPKIIIKEVPQDNSNKSQVDMVLFNNEYIPKAEVYEI